MFHRLLSGLLLACLFVAQPAFAATDPLDDAPPAYLEALRNAVRNFNARDFPKTIEALDDAERIRPPSALTLNTRGASLIEMKQYDQGAALCRKAVELDPQFYPARFNLCEVLLVQKRYREARELFQKLLDENSGDELVRFRILLTWLLEKNDTQARRILDSIPFPGNTPAYYYGNAAWEFAHENAPEAQKWIMRGNWVFKPQITVNFSQPFQEIGWITDTPGASKTLPEFSTEAASTLTIPGFPTEPPVKK
ncbi:MAG: hypothetical protein QOE70_2809 [Chthoniobacter sp.]|jgi:tetratricopeptide (TPR) repeat protein|nr:hypothetical protein [Chthoniobacter sp.]